MLPTINRDIDHLDGSQAVSPGMHPNILQSNTSTIQQVQPGEVTNEQVASKLRISGASASKHGFSIEGLLAKGSYLSLKDEEELEMLA